MYEHNRIKWNQCKSMANYNRIFWWHVCHMYQVFSIQQNATKSKQQHNSTITATFSQNHMPKGITEISLKMHKWLYYYRDKISYWFSIPCYHVQTLMSNMRGHAVLPAYFQKLSLLFAMGKCNHNLDSWLTRFTIILVQFKDWSFFKIRMSIPFYLPNSIFLFSNRFNITTRTFWIEINLNCILENVLA